MKRSHRAKNLLIAVVLMLATLLSPSWRLCAEGSDSAVSKSSRAPTEEAIPDSAPKPKAASQTKTLAKPSAATKAERTAVIAKGASAAAEITSEREATAISFATRNHPELAILLSNLKQNNPSEYRAAVVELDRVVERLATLKQKNVAQHDLELAHWQRDSRIRLMAARLTMSDNPALEAELKAAVREKLEQTLAERKTERERLQKRVEKLDQSIDDLANKLDELAQKEFAALVRSTQSSRPKAKSKTNKKSELKVAP